jgi:hypothetical protein
MEFRDLFRCKDARRNSPTYKAKKRIVKNIWIVAGAIISVILNVPGLYALAVALMFIITFLCFVILDETDDD